ncbi:MAG: GrpB family protein [Kutzneria sp.]|nr:GrpB family protein [Kutzneria sp.]MBV9847656.1 GrpB family protein [Kutzneria sp.]
MLTIDVVAKHTELGHRVAALLTELDRGQQAHVKAVPNPGALDTGQEPAAFVVAVTDSAGLAHREAFSFWADVVLVHGSDTQRDRSIRHLWQTRLAPFAQNLADQQFARAGAPELSASDPTWQTTANRLIRRLRRATAHLGRAGEFRWEHIGSTSVPGLSAKPFIDLQLGVASLDELHGLDQAVFQCGFIDVATVAPDSPGVLRDTPRGTGHGPDACWDKRLFASADPGQRVILHVREIGSPWWRYTIRFRDLLRADSEARQDYERLKARLVEAHSGDQNNDAYTIAKTVFFDAIQDRLDQ